MLSLYTLLTVQGIDARLWKQAQLDNPSPKKLLPVPMIGFKSLQQRIRSQEGQSKSHQGRLDLVAEDIATLQRRHQVVGGFFSLPLAAITARLLL